MPSIEDQTRVTVRDIARLVGVSASTVSRALSSPELVAPGTRAKVQRAARDLGYSLPGTIEPVARERTRNIGLVVPDLENPFFASITKGAQSRATARGYATFVADFDEDRLIEPGLVRSLAQQVDGLVLCSARAEDGVLADIASRTPVVLVNRELGDTASVVLDDADGMRQAVAHLYALGHRRVAWADGPVASWSGQRRREGLRSAGASYGDLEIVELGHFRPTFDGGLVAADQAVAARVTAVVAYSGIMAVGVMGRLRDRGILVPDQISVIGVDELPMAAMTSPQLTTVSTPLIPFGRAAVDLLLSVIDGGLDGQESSERHLVHPAELLIRASTAVPPTAD